MKYVFFGTPDFAAIILKKLIGAGLPPMAVVCNPDRPVGRKKIITPPPIKKLILEENRSASRQIEILQPENAREIKQKLLSINADVFIVAAYAKILPKEIIELSRLGVIGIHPSLLPKYRGTTPIQTAILNGEKETGTTLFLIDEKVDHGPILAAGRLSVAEKDTYETLLKKLAELSGDLIVKNLPEYVRGGVIPKPQNETEATYTKKIKTEDAYVDPEILQQAQDGTNPENAKTILRKVLALNPEPGAWTVLDGKRTKILEAEIAEEKLKLKKIQIEGKKPTTLQKSFS